MFDFTIGDIASATQQARLLQSQERGRVAYTLHAASAPQKHRFSGGCREAVAKALIALAARLTSTAQTSPTTSNV